MSGKSMDVFALRDAIVGEYRKFATSFTTIHAEDMLTCPVCEVPKLNGSPAEARLLGRDP